MITPAREVRLAPDDRSVLELRLRSPTTEQRHVLRARVVLLAAKGLPTRSIAARLGTMPPTISLWRICYADGGLAGLGDKARPGGRASSARYDACMHHRILAQLDQPPPAGYARWTGKLLARTLGDVSEQYVRRFLRGQKIDLDGRKSGASAPIPSSWPSPLRLNREVRQRMWELYLAPPDGVVLSIDEKPSI